MSERAIPVPIPNTEVKPLSADDSRKAKVGRRQDNGLFCTYFLLANWWVYKRRLTTNLRQKTAQNYVINLICE